ncbi:DUF2891 domain-containing protein [bacterium]|nr:DUF2891 domain-containing protein [bacterium]
MTRFILHKMLGFIIITAMSITSCTPTDSGDTFSAKEIKKSLSLTESRASHFAQMALQSAEQEYPNKPGHVLNNASEILAPRKLHPAFYGCFDWHSAVHGHWLLISVLKQYPDIPEAAEIIRVLDQHLTVQNIKAEVAYFKQKNRKSFERTYGWAWLLKLAEELYTADESRFSKWYEAVSPLAHEIAMRYLEYLPKQTYPIRTGVHPNTAFGLTFALDYARATEHSSLEELIIKKATQFYAADNHYPIAWEPGSEDFLSPALMEAELMHRVLNMDEYEEWLGQFWPGLSKATDKNMLNPVTVTDRNDPKIVHLDGLNLSRAWCMLGIASNIDDSKIKKILINSAASHANNALNHIDLSAYEGGHWLGSFAMLVFLEAQK